MSDMGFTVQPAANMMKMKKNRCSAGGWVRCAIHYWLTAAGCCCRIIWLFRTHLLVSWAKQQQQIDTIGRQASSPWPTTTNGRHLQLPCSLLRCWLLGTSRGKSPFHILHNTFPSRWTRAMAKIFAFLKMKLAIYLARSFPRLIYQ